jgi:hypothetical protein
METVEDRRDVHIDIVVNETAVRLKENRLNGLDLKRAAIAQGCPIDTRGRLFRMRGDRQIPVDDDQVIKVHEREHFRCISPDDNS